MFPLLFPFLFAPAIFAAEYPNATTTNVPASGASMLVSMSVASLLGGAGGFVVRRLEAGPQRLDLVFHAPPRF